MTNGLSSLEKYTSHFIERVLCERDGDWTKTATYWSHQLLRTLQCVLLVLLGCSTGGLRAPSAGCWFSLPHLYSNWLTSCLHPGYIIVRHPPSSCERHKSHSVQPVHGQGYILIFFYRMHLLFTQVHFLFWQLCRVRGQYATQWGVCFFKSTFLNNVI